MTLGGMNLGSSSLPVAGQVLLGLLAGIAAVIDIRSRRIPNWLALAGIAAGLGWNAYFGGTRGLLHAALGLGTGFLLYFPLYLIRARGAGDVKLLTAVGAICGPTDCFRVFLLTAIVGGAIVLVLVVLAGRLRRTFFNIGWILYDLIRFRSPHRSNAEFDVTSDKGFRVPHAVMIAAGSAAFLFLTDYGSGR